MMKSSSLLMQFSPNRNVGLTIMFFFGHALQGNLLNFRLSLYIYILDWTFLMPIRYARAEIPQICWRAPLTRYFFLHVFILVLNICSVQSHKPLHLIAVFFYCFGFLWTDLHLSSVFLCIIPPKMAALVWETAVATSSTPDGGLFSSCLEWHNLF